MLLEEIGKTQTGKTLSDCQTLLLEVFLGGCNLVSKQDSANGIDQRGQGELERTTHDCIQHILMHQIHLDYFSLLDENKSMLFPIFLQLLLVY